MNEVIADMIVVLAPVSYANTAISVEDERNAAAEKGLPARSSALGELVFTGESEVMRRVA
jgi:hypothetical protein